MERLADYTQSLKDRQARRTIARTFTCLARANGVPEMAANYARSRRDWADVEQIIRPLMAAVPGHTTSSDPALIGVLSNDVMSVVRPLTILGRLPVRVTSFSAALTYMNGGTSSAWVGEGQAVPVSRASFSRLATPLDRLQNVAFSVEDLELVKTADPAAEMVIAQDFVTACVAGIDTSFIDPQSAAIAGIRPASVTNGAPAFASSGSTAALFDADFGRMIESLLARGSTLQAAYWVMHPITVLFLARLLNVNGDRAYPLLSVRTGGELLGLPVIVSASVPHVGSPPSTSIYLVDAERIWVAQDPTVELSISQRGAVQMLDNPTGSIAPPTATTLVSLFQTNSVALRGTRTINWKIADPGFACVLNNVVD